MSDTPDVSQMFQCPRCWQRYRLPPVTIGQIRTHLRERHGLVVDSRWVKRRLRVDERKP